MARRLAREAQGLRGDFSGMRGADWSAWSVGIFSSGGGLGNERLVGLPTVVRMLVPARGVDPGGGGCQFPSPLWLPN
jgi:hypothetical protein